MQVFTALTRLVYVHPDVWVIRIAEEYVINTELNQIQDSIWFILVNQSDQVGQ